MGQCAPPKQSARDEFWNRVTSESSAIASAWSQSVMKDCLTGQTLDEKTLEQLEKLELEKIYLEMFNKITEWYNVENKRSGTRDAWDLDNDGKLDKSEVSRLVEDSLKETQKMFEGLIRQATAEVIKCVGKELDKVNDNKIAAPKVQTAEEKKKAEDDKKAEDAKSAEVKEAEKKKAAEAAAEEKKKAETKEAKEAKAKKDAEKKAVLENVEKFFKKREKEFTDAVKTKIAALLAKEKLKTVVDGLFNKLDVNKDGSISAEEFSQFATVFSSEYGLVKLGSDALSAAKAAAAAKAATQPAAAATSSSSSTSASTSTSSGSSSSTTAATTSK